MSTNNVLENYTQRAAAVQDAQAKKAISKARRPMYDNGLRAAGAVATIIVACAIAYHYIFKDPIVVESIVVQTVEVPYTINGKDGKDGRDGRNGRDGNVGVTGATGATGPQGEQGPRGASGITGQDGINGQNGVNGQNGSDGIDGNKGNKGDTGTKGADGEKGDTGDKGDKGANSDEVLELLSKLDGKISSDDLEFLSTLTPEAKLAYLECLVQFYSRDHNWNDSSSSCKAI